MKRHFAPSHKQWKFRNTENKLFLEKGLNGTHIPKFRLFRR